MCGKFTQLASWRVVHAFSQPLDKKDLVVISAPMRFANIIRLNEAGAREVAAMRWGFTGKGDANPSRPNTCTPARCETVDRLPTFANAFAHGRGLLLVHIFNEGEEVPERQDKAVSPHAERQKADCHCRAVREVDERQRDV